jgi:hypothetical protein
VRLGLCIADEWPYDWEHVDAVLAHTGQTHGSQS